MKKVISVLFIAALTFFSAKAFADGADDFIQGKELYVDKDLLDLKPNGDLQFDLKVETGAEYFGGTRFPYKILDITSKNNEQIAVPYVYINRGSCQSSFMRMSPRWKVGFGATVRLALNDPNCNIVEVIIVTWHHGYIVYSSS